MPCRTAARRLAPPPAAPYNPWMARAEVFVDCFGRRVRLTAERRRHILEHPEMVEWMNSIGDALARPGRVVRSGSNRQAELFYV